MSTFHVELKKTVDDSYEIEVGRSLAEKLARDLEHGLAGGCRRFALITDSNVEQLYAEPIRGRLLNAGFEGEIFAFPAGRNPRPGRPRRRSRTGCWKPDTGGTALCWRWEAAWCRTWPGS